jgi:hypothetical protein
MGVGTWYAGSCRWSTCTDVLLWHLQYLPCVRVLVHHTRGTHLHVLGEGRAGSKSAQPRIREVEWRGEQDYVPYHAVGVFVWVIFRDIMAPRTTSATKAQYRVGRRQNLLVTCEDLATAREPTKEFTASACLTLCLYAVRDQVMACNAMYARPAACDIPEPTI